MTADVSTASTPAPIAPGTEFGGRRVLTEHQLELAIALTGGTHPVHTSASAAQAAGFRGRIFHGAVSAALMAAAIGAHFRDEQIALLEQNNRFAAPTHPGDVLDSAWTVDEVRAAKRSGDTILALRGRMTNQDGVVVLESRATVLLRRPS
ncbi:bifunctional enoyl-CoA hydratase/phosphate acetyltransferase [Variovorax sp. SRS16]|uniref:MaoC family dehydratase n=1 Tax=Variovorax sp. SRS16 TaxID=282217 RepID=UPI0013190E39|nr:MaoC family dehydratase [Variovorax sp. SRS16]VTU12867.1 bifunctional enoyl-CoA hydratase/phosphate acetyltransferase [Variovorax sp. SRS16]